MGYGYFNLKEFNSDNSGMRANIAKNSLTVLQGTPIVLAATWVEAAAAGWRIDGISVTKKTFDSDNYSVAKEMVSYYPEPNLANTYSMKIEWGTITVADEGKFYDLILNDSIGFAIDGTSESATTWQCQLVKFVSDEESIFRIANA